MEAMQPELPPQPQGQPGRAVDSNKVIEGYQRRLATVTAEAIMLEALVAQQDEQIASLLKSLDGVQQGAESVDTGQGPEAPSS